MTGHRAQYGTWPSPLSAELLAAGGIAVAGPVQRGDEMWWAERRPAEGGRLVLVMSRGGYRDPVDVLAPPFSARSLVHEYGGGAWWLGRTAAYFTNFDDQRLYSVDSDGGPVALTPEPPAPRAWRYADGQEHPDGDWVVCVRERHGDTDEPVNELVAVSTNAGLAEPSAWGSSSISCLGRSAASLKRAVSARSGQIFSGGESKRQVQLRRWVGKPAKSVTVG